MTADDLYEALKQGMEQAKSEKKPIQISFISQTIINVYPNGQYFITQKAFNKKKTFIKKSKPKTKPEYKVTSIDKETEEY